MSYDDHDKIEGWTFIKEIERWDFYQNEKNNSLILLRSGPETIEWDADLTIEFNTGPGGDWSFVSIPKEVLVEYLTMLGWKVTPP